MRVLQVVSGDLWGGAEAQVLLQTSALRALHRDVQLLTFNRREPFDRFLAAGIACYCVSEAQSFVPFLRGVVRQVRTIAPALLVAHGYKESLVAFAVRVCLGIPWIATFHGWDVTANRSRLRTRLYTGLYRYLARVSAARVVVVSPAIAGALRFQGLSKVRTVLNVARVDRRSDTPGDADCLPTLGLRPTVVCVGRLVEVKRLDLAIRAVCELRRSGRWYSLSLALVGDGPERERLNGLAEELGCSEAVTFTGFRRDIGAVLAGADLLLITSRSEGLPTVLLEAILAGVPVVSTDVGGIRDVLRMFAGYPAIVVPPDDVQALADAISRVLRGELGVADRANVQATFHREFAPAAAATRLAAVYEEVCARAPGEQHDH